MTAWVLIAVLAGIAIVLMLRQPLRAWRRHQVERDQERKRQWRKDREERREQRRRERAMNPAKAAARKGPPSLAQVARENGAKCWLCGTRTFDDDVLRETSGKQKLGATFPVIDYVVAIDHGGTFEVSNARIAHNHCATVRSRNPTGSKFGRPPRTFPPTG